LAFFVVYQQSGITSGTTIEINKIKEAELISFNKRFIKILIDNIFNV